ncbi:AbrB/MazE/SpoVT family DNA-binding domain-containing protein [Amycolatopsis acidiphila]|uniref:AbrB/MazE/SpoVT family DNA-binding domain-containing protein n=1 Tax=Amycolatopsis acidiphila TaxID=715473 RepID=A0A557ZU20_9PSEU|nr:AbrB/MazE/SpoVT family DNA-binding domain-containing protein [Amycolatopsis acidiphila]
MSTMDCRGRITDRAIVAALGWRPGTLMTIRQARALLLIRTDLHGTSGVTPQGHLRLPAALRHASQLSPGDRLLLAAYPSHDLLIVQPPAALDELLAPHHRHLLAVTA